MKREYTTCDFCEEEQIYARCSICGCELCRSHTHGGTNSAGGLPGLLLRLEFPICPKCARPNTRIDKAMTKAFDELTAIFSDARAEHKKFAARPSDDAMARSIREQIEAGVDSRHD